MPINRFTPAIILIIIFVFLGFLVLRNQDEQGKLENLLKGVSIDAIEVDGKPYSIKAGKVQEAVDKETSLKILRLVAFYQWNREDPLFDSPDFDPQKFQATLKILLSEEQLMINALNTDKHIYPVSFLQNLVDTSTINKSFLEKPSFLEAQKLIESQTKTADSYKSDADTFLKYIADAVPRKNETFNIQITTEVINSDFEKIIKNGEILASEIERRKKCLLGSGDCVRPIFRVQRPANVNFEQANPPEFIDVGLIIPGVNSYSSNNKGIYRTTTPCFGWGDNFTEPEHYFYARFLNVYLSTRTNNDRAALRIGDVKLATDAFYRKIEEGAGSTDKVLLERQVEYAGIPSSTPYFCTNREFVHKVAQLNSFLVGHKPIFGNFSVGGHYSGFFEEAREKEAEFFSQKYPSYEDLLVLSQYYFYAYRLFCENSSSSWAKDDSTAEELLLRSLEIERKMGDFGASIYPLIKFTQGERFREVTTTNLDEEYTKVTFQLRNYYGSLYLPFSKSIWRSTDPVQYLARKMIVGAIGEEGGYQSYWDLVKIYPKEQIEKWNVDATALGAELAGEAEEEP